MPGIHGFCSFFIHGKVRNAHSTWQLRPPSINAESAGLLRGRVASGVLEVRRYFHHALDTLSLRRYIDIIAGLHFACVHVATTE